MARGVHFDPTFLYQGNLAQPGSYIYRGAYHPNRYRFENFSILTSGQFRGGSQRVPPLQYTPKN